MSWESLGWFVEWSIPVRHFDRLTVQGSRTWSLVVTVAPWSLLRDLSLMDRLLHYSRYYSLLQEEMDPQWEQERQRLYNRLHDFITKFEDAVEKPISDANDNPDEYLMRVVDAEVCLKASTFFHLLMFDDVHSTSPLTSHRLSVGICPGISCGRQFSGTFGHCSRTCQLRKVTSFTPLDLFSSSDP